MYALVEIVVRTASEAMKLKNCNETEEEGKFEIPLSVHFDGAFHQCL